MSDRSDRPTVDCNVRWRDDLGESVADGGRGKDDSVSAETAADLRRLADALEAVNWHEVPTVSAVTAAVFARLVEAALGRTDR